MIELKENTIDLVNKTNQLLKNEKAYKNIKEIEFENLLEFGIVYVVYENEKPVYIGKSKGKYFKSRLKSHFEGVGVNSGTKSKYNRIKDSENIKLKFVKTNPCALRNMLEELLIDDFKQKYELWNFKK